MAKAKQIKNIQAPPVSDPARAPYTPPEAKSRGNGGGNPNAEHVPTDKVYGVASRDRWPGSSDVSQQLRDSRKIEGSDTSSEDEDEDEEYSEEDTGGAALTVAELKAALDEAEIEYDKSAKKAELVELYDTNGLGGE